MMRGLGGRCNGCTSAKGIVRRRRRRRWERCQERRCRQHRGAPEETFASAIEGSGWVRGVGEVCAKDLYANQYSIRTHIAAAGIFEVALTPPAASLTTRTQELRRGSDGAAHFLYKVARLTPSFSRLYTSDHVSANCSLGGTNSRISSAKERDSICADSGEPSGTPVRDSGVRGGGWNGEAVRCGGVYMPLCMLRAGGG